MSKEDPYAHLPPDQRPVQMKGHKRVQGRYSSDDNVSMDPAVEWALMRWLPETSHEKTGSSHNGMLDFLLWHQLVGMGGDPGTTFRLPTASLRSNGIGDVQIGEALTRMQALGILVFAYSDAPSKAMLLISLADWHEIIAVVPPAYWTKLYQMDKEQAAMKIPRKMTEGLEYYTKPSFVKYQAQYLQYRIEDADED